MNVQRARFFAPAALSLLLACATTPEAPRKEFKPIGEVRFAQTGNSLSSSFSEERVVSPGADLTQSADGSWRGRMGESVIDVNVYPNRVAGSGLTLTQEVVQGGNIYVGQIDGKIFRFEVGAQKVLIRAPTYSATFGRNSDGSFGPGGILKLEGEAGKLPGRWPQLPLALLAAFISSAGAQGHNAN